MIIFKVWLATDHLAEQRATSILAVLLLHRMHHITSRIYHFLSVMYHLLYQSKEIAQGTHSCILDEKSARKYCKALYLN